jgi:outer membrane protein, heavy metal efflux system
MGARERTLVLAGLALLPAIVAAAQAPAPLSEKEFLARFERTDPRFEALRARAASSGAEVVRARALANPSLSLDREQVRGQPEDFVRLSVPLDVSGRRSRTIAAAEMGARAAGEEASFDTLALLLDGLDAYHEAAYLRLRATILHEGRDELARLVEAVRARHQAGDAAGYDRDRLELELGSYDDLLAGAEADLAGARVTLARLAGEPGARFDASDELGLPPTSAGANALAADALATRADRRTATLRLRQAEREASAARRAWIPTLALSGGLKRVVVDDGFGEATANGFIVGLSLSLPIFDHGQADLARGLAEARRWRATSLALERDIQTDVRRAQELLQARIAQARRYRETQLGRAQDLVRRAETAYREGDRPVFELLDAYRTAREVRLRELELRRQARRAWLDLWRAIGRRP